jgi:DNA invertase Pin-like site-specific DNA recombinase
LKRAKSKGKPKDDSGPQLIGYARVSTEDQSLALQTDALEKAGCLNIYPEKISGAKKVRPQLDLAIKDLRPGDTLVVWRLDRLSRSMRDLYGRLEEIHEAGASFKSLTEHFDFNTATGKLILGMLAVMAEFERQLTIERTKAGMAVLRGNGFTLGAPVKFDKDAQREAKRLLKLRERRKVRGKLVWRPVYTKREIAEKLKVSTGTLFNWIREQSK